MRTHSRVNTKYTLGKGLDPIAIGFIISSFELRCICVGRYLTAPIYFTPTALFSGLEVDHKGSG